MCLADGGACLLAGRCAGHMGFQPDSRPLIHLTILADSPALARVGPSRVVREAGEAALGREAVRVAGGSWSVAPDGGVLYSGFGSMETGEGAVAAFRSPRGDGFTLERASDGRGARLTVRELAAGRPGRLLASERVGERDALVARVTLNGRPCVLVVQAPTLPGAEAGARAEAALRELRDSDPGRVETPIPPFEIRILN